MDKKMKNEIDLIERNLIHDTKEALRKGSSDRVEKLFRGRNINPAYHTWSIVQGLSEFVGDHTLLTYKQLDALSLLINLLKTLPVISSVHLPSFVEIFETLYHAGNVRRSLLAFFEEHGDGETVLPLNTIIKENEWKISVDEIFRNFSFQQKFEKEAINRTQIACLSSKNNTFP